MSVDEGAIEVHHLWKRFRPDTGGSLAKYELQKMQERLGRGKVQWVWALRDVHFDIEPGSAVGLIGNNGSGKSTLLKVINQVMFPYAGHTAVGGRIGALIEVRAGIQPELSGRENIYLYGALLGFSKAEMRRRFDDIVEWAEIGFAIDRQVKYYSSGMGMRLGFAVAVFLDPSVLLVDEVLSVGDARFQQRCLDRMREATSTGTTLLFVSHDLAAVGAACKRGIWIHNGVLQADGTIADILGAYRRSVEVAAAAAQLRHSKIRMLNATIEHPQAATPMTQEPVEVRMHVESDVTGIASVYLGVTEGTSDPIFVFRHYIDFSEGTLELRCQLPRLPLPKGHYYLWLGVIDHKVSPNEDLFVWSPIARFDVFGPGLDDPPDAVVRRAPFHVEYQWDYAEADRREALEASVEYTPPALPGQ